ncbi:MAG: DUF4149 domain-containing protein [Pseudomonadota bacterium]
MLVTALIAVSILLGAMVFFPAVVAPLVFRTLEPAAAGAFLRALFPRYYAFMIATSGIAGVLLLPSTPVPALLLLAVAASTLWVRQWLVPKLNGWRDLELAGDAEAGARFAKGHRLSVIINVLQLLLILALLIQQLLALTS